MKNWDNTKRVFVIWTPKGHTRPTEDTIGTVAVYENKRDADSFIAEYPQFRIRTAELVKDRYTKHQERSDEIIKWIGYGLIFLMGLDFGLSF